METDLNVMDKKWKVILVPHRREKFVGEILSRLDLECYIPLIRKTKKYQRKIKFFDIPLISNYVFVKITTAEEIKILQTPNVQGFLTFGKRKATVPENEINILRRICNEGVNVDFGNETHVEVGQEVEIVSGNLTGIKGKIIQNCGPKQVLIELTSIGLSLRIHINNQKLNYLNRTFQVA